MANKVISPRTEIKKIGIVGCGLMGSQYVQLCAEKGFKVVVSEINEEVLKKGLKIIENRLEEKLRNKDIKAKDKNIVLDRISGTTKAKSFSDCDLVIESATENMELKKKIFSELDQVCPEDVVLGTNTSVLSILDIAAATKRPDKVVGIHGRPLIGLRMEVIETIATSRETLEVAKQFCRSVGKKIIVAKDTPGFIVNRLITPFILDAIRMLEAGIATRDDIDDSFTLSFGWSMGPLTMADGIGLDTLLSGVNAMYEELKDPRFITPVLLKKMVTAGWFGVKTGKGFYEYGK